MALVSSVVVLLGTLGVVVLATRPMAVLVCTAHAIMPLPVASVGLSVVCTVLIVALVVARGGYGRINIIFIRIWIFGIVLI